MKKTISYSVIVSLTTAALCIFGLMPAHGQEKARSADGFVDSIGLDTHFGYEDTPTDPYSDYNSCKGWLTSLGIRHIRDGSDIQAGSSKLAMQQTFKNLYTQAGIQTTFVVTPNYGGQPSDVVNMINTITPGALDAIEGPNEPDIFSYTYNGNSGYPAVKNWMKDIYALVKSTGSTRMVAVIAPAMAHNNEPNLAPLTSMDFQATHNYQAGQMPTATLPGYVTNSDEVVGTGYPNRAIFATESGYSVGTGSDWPISSLAQGKYTSRMLTEDYLAGIARTYIYQLVQDGGQTFGLLTTNTSSSLDTGSVYRPSYNAVKNMISTLHEATWSGSQWSYPTFTPGYLNYAIGTGGVSSIHHLLLQKSNGDFYVVLWNEASVYNTSTSTDITNATVPVTLTFTTSVSSAANVWTQNTDGTYTSTPATVSGSRLTVNVPDSMMIVKVSPTGGLSATQTVPSFPALAGAIACGSTTAYGNFQADNSSYTYTNASPLVDGGMYGTSSTIDTSGVTNPAPMDVYQHERWGISAYNISGLTPGTAYLVRLHFAEISTNTRQFDVVLNGNRVVTNFNIYATVGMNKALEKDFVCYAGLDGKIIPQFLMDAVNYPKIAGIEVWGPTTPPATYYTITSRYWNNNAINTQMGFTCSLFTPGWYSTEWRLNPVGDGSGAYYIVNRGTGQAINIQYGFACSAYDPSWWSAQWFLTPVNDGSGTDYLVNRWTSGAINTEYGFGYGTYQPTWWSAEWWVTPASW